MSILLKTLRLIIGIVLAWAFLNRGSSLLNDRDDIHNLMGVLLLLLFTAAVVLTASFVWRDIWKFLGVNNDKTTKFK